MAKYRPKLDDFLIDVDITAYLEDLNRLVMEGGRAIIRIDLSDPDYKAAVLKVAGRFRNLERKRRGGPPTRYISCLFCRETVHKSLLDEHLESSHGKKVVSVTEA